METQLSINALEKRQNELLAEMSKSDAHALKCNKLGKSFADEYPEDFAAYQAANAEYNENEQQLAALRAQLEEERAAEAAAVRPEEVEGE